MQPYAVLQTLHLGERSHVVRARGESGATVIVKQIPSEYPSAAGVARLRREYDLLRLLDGEGASRPIEFDTRGGARLVTEDHAAVSLSTWMAEARDSAERVVEVALALSRALARVHARGVVHRDVNPSNVVVRPEPLAVWLIDFDLASPDAQRRVRPQPLPCLEGTPAYLSPEQTGRTNHPVDARSDLYSLGVSLYEVLSGRLPFQCADPLAWAHAHLAADPPPLRPLVAGLPPALHELVAILLRKEPQDRYQCAAGVVADLEGILNEVRGGPAATTRSADLTDRVVLPHAFLSREPDVAALHEDLVAVTRGERRVILVSGEAGIGKTSLVRELYRPVTLAGARMFEGKFDQFSRDNPFAALAQVLAAMCSDTLAGTAEQVDLARDAIVGATAPNTRLLVDMAPSLGLLVGAQPEVAALPAQEAIQRLQETMRRALTAIAHHAPLVLFLDDLQWADLPSLQVIEALFRNPSLRSVLLVASWRSEEVGPAHPLVHTLASLRQSDVPIRHLELGPLGEEDVRRMLASALRVGPEEVSDLSRILYGKSAGNPFFLHRIVESAWAAGAFTFDALRLRWRWTNVAIQDLAPADNVVALLRTELERVSGDTRSVLAAAALLSDAFAFDTLGIATDLPLDRARAACEAGVRGRFLHPLDNHWWDSGNPDRVRFTFTHDRVQQAARDLQTADEIARTHLRLARGLSARPTLAANPFQIAEHYVAARGLVTDPAERSELVRIATQAGERAMLAAAAELARRLLEAAVEVAGEAYWATHPGEAAHLRRLAARAAWVTSDPAALDTHVAALRAHAKTALEVVLAEEVVVSANIARGALSDALDDALRALGAAGTGLPRTPTAADVGAAVSATLGALSDVDEDACVATILDPADRLEAAQRRLLVGIASAAYVSETNLVPLIACSLVQRTVLRGASNESSYGFGLLGLALCAGWHLEAGLHQGRLALRFLAAFPDPTMNGFVRHVVDNYVRVWEEPLRPILIEGTQVLRWLMDTGNLEYAGWNLVHRVIQGLWCEPDLGAFQGEVQRYLRVMELNNHHAAAACSRPCLVFIENLRGEHVDPTRMRSAGFDEDEAMAEFTRTGFFSAAMQCTVVRLVLRLSFWDLQGAAAIARDAIAYHQWAVAIWYQTTWRVYGAVALLHEDNPSPAPIDEVLTWRDSLVATARTNPSNGAHPLAMFDAELARARGDLAEAIRLWDLAIEGAARAGFLLDEAFVNERVGRFHHARGARRAARGYLLEARFAWQRWGASAKVAQIDDDFGDLIRAPAGRALSFGGGTAHQVPHGELDFESVLKAAFAIAQESDLERLMCRGLEVLVENVGARRGALVLVRRGSLVVEAIATIGAPVTLEGSAPLSKLPAHAEGVIRRVHRSGAPEVFDHGATRGVDDPISVLCTPITHQGRPLGVLYFDNDRTGAAFTAERVRVLDALAPQLAVTIRNLRLQAAQDRFVPRQFLRSLDREDIVDVEIGDHKLAEISIFFSDIWGFTPLVERLDASGALDLINRYLSFAEPAITDNAGFVDTYLGDGIMALFDEGGRNAQQAVAAAIALHAALDRLNVERRAGGLREIRTGVGINTGTVTMATIGGVRGLKCGVVGDPVNLASRIEGMTRRCVSRVLISGLTRDRLSDTSSLGLRTAGVVRVVGRRQPLTVFEVLAAEREEVFAERAATIEVFERAFAAYVAGEPDDAVSGFATCLRRAPDDPQALRLLQAAQKLQRDGVPPGWTGVDDLTTK